MSTAEKVIVSTVEEKRRKTYFIVAVGLMSALVYAGNFMSIPLVNETRIHLGNAPCLLAALLFGGVSGGLSSGIGGFLYDLFNPVYMLSAPYTFFSKFSMGWVAGKLNRSGIKNELARTTIAAIIGQITYIILYLGKAFIEQLILGNPVETAAGVMFSKAATSFTNGFIAVVIAVPLSIALRKALKASGFASLIEGKTERKGYFNPLTTCLTVFAIIVTAGFAIRLSADSKIKSAEEAKEAAYQQQIDDLSSKLDNLYAQLGVELPESEPEPEQTE